LLEGVKRMWGKTILGLMAILLLVMLAGRVQAEPVAINSSGAADSTSSLQLLEHVGYAVGGTLGGTAGGGSSNSLASGADAGDSSSSQSGLAGSSGTDLLPPGSTTSSGTTGSSSTGGGILNPTIPTDSTLDPTNPGPFDPLDDGPLSSNESVPEPSTIGLVACLAGIGVIVWTRRGKSKASRR
jgi:hypothetical protein